MRYATFSLSNDPKQQLGVVRNDRLLNLGKLVGPRVSDPIPGSLREFIEQGPQAWRRMKSLVESEESGSGTSRPDVFPRPEDVHLHAPIPRPAKNVMCLGLNYALHMEESARARGREVKIPEVPVFFTKAPTAVNGGGARHRDRRRRQKHLPGKRHGTCLWIHDYQRRFGAGLASETPAMVQGQEPGRLLPYGAARGYGGRIWRSARQTDFLASERRRQAERQHVGYDLQSAGHY